jgi:hypothetical protein
VQQVGVFINAGRLQARERLVQQLVHDRVGHRLNAFALLVGQFLGGPDEGNRSALAITCAARHPGVAISVATGLFPSDSAEIFGMAGLFVLTSALMAIPYLKWRKTAIEG